jgi:hypothetical protein
MYIPYFFYLLSQGAIVCRDGAWHGGAQKKKE